MPPVAVSRKLSVMSQPSLDEFERLAERGFGTVINNRPDGEDADQPGSSAEESASRAAGLSYVQIPVTSAGMMAEDARRFQQAVDASPGPVGFEIEVEFLGEGQTSSSALRKQAAEVQTAGENA